MLSLASPTVLLIQVKRLYLILPSTPPDLRLTTDSV